VTGAGSSDAISNSRASAQDVEDRADYFAAPLVISGASLGEVLLRVLNPSPPTALLSQPRRQTEERQCDALDDWHS
jgi:hypothetical protein